MDNKKEHRFSILIALGYGFAFFTIPFLLFHIKNQTYYFIYPKTTQFFTYLILIFSLIGIIAIITKNQGLRKFKKFKTGKLVIFVFSIILLVSLFFGSLQYLIYITDKDTFQIDKDLLNSQTKKETNKIKEIIESFEKEKDFLINLKNKIDTNESYQLEFNQKYMLFGLLENRQDRSYKFMIDDYNLLLESDFNARHPPPKGHAHPESDFIRFLKINKDLDEYIIYKDTATVKYFVNVFNNPKSISAYSLLSIINNQLLKTSIRVENLEENIKLINKRGIPLSLFSYDTFMKSIHFDQNYYKPVTWIGRILYFIQIIISIYFLIPLISRSIDKFWKKN